MNWSIVFSVTTYLAIAIIVISVVLRVFKKFRLYIPIIIGLLLLISVGGSFALRVSSMTVDELVAYFNITVDDVATIQSSNNLLLYAAGITIIVVYIACLCEGISMGIKYLLKRRRKQKEFDRTRRS